MCACPANLFMIRCGNVSHDDSNGTQSFGFQHLGRPCQGGHACIDETGVSCEVFDGVARQNHFGENDYRGTALLCLLNRVDDEVNIARKVADDRVYLGEGEANSRHTK